MALKISKPTTVDLPWPEARSRAEAELQPIFVSIKPWADDRGWSLMNLLTGALSKEGQINYSVQYPGVVKAWHRHAKQTDFWICTTGHIKVGVYNESEDVAWSMVIGARNPGVLIIPTPLWHGAATVGNESAGLLYYVTNAYNPKDPDEDRRAWDSVKGFPWAVQNG